MIDSPRLLADLKKLLPRLEDDLRVRSEEDAATGDRLKVDPAPKDLVVEALDGLKFSAYVPRDLALEMLRARLEDPAAYEKTLGSPLDR